MLKFKKYSHERRFLDNTLVQGQQSIMGNQGNKKRNVQY